MNAQEFMALYESGERDFKGIDLSGEALSDLELEGVDLSGATLIGTDFNGSSLLNAALVGANLLKANLESTKLIGADLAEASLTKATYNNLTGWPEGFEFRSCHALGPGAMLDGMDLSGIDVRRLDLSGAQMVGANLQGAILAGAFLENANLMDANLEGADLSFAHLTESNLCNANLQGATLIQTMMTGAELTGANLSQAQYDRTTLWPHGFSPMTRGAEEIDQLDDSDATEITINNNTMAFILVIARVMLCLVFIIIGFFLIAVSLLVILSEPVIAVPGLVIGSMSGYACIQALKQTWNAIRVMTIGEEIRVRYMFRGVKVYSPQDVEEIRLFFRRGKVYGFQIEQHLMVQVRFKQGAEALVRLPGQHEGKLMAVLRATGLETAVLDVRDVFDEEASLE